MATSGNTILQLTRNQFVEAAFGIIGVLAQGQTPSAEDYTIGSLMLNTTIARFRTLGLPLWARKTHSWVPTTSSYTIGDGQTLDTPYPIHIIQAYRSTTDGARIPMDIEADFDYNSLPTSAGGDIPFKLSYTPYIDYGIIKLWPTALTANTDTVTIVYTRPLEYFDSSTNNLDMPNEWYDAVIWDLAVKLAPRWGVPLNDRNMLKQEAKVFFEQAQQSGFEDASLFIHPYRRPAE